jgi:hypothetical protein
MSIWKTKWGWRAEFMLNGERIRAQGFFRYKDEARQWIKDEKERVKEKKQQNLLRPIGSIRFTIYAKHILRIVKQDTVQKLLMKNAIALNDFTIPLET